MTGALIVSGGVGIEKKLYVGGNAIITGNLIVTGDISNPMLDRIYIELKTKIFDVSSNQTSLVSVNTAQTIYGVKTFFSALNVTNITESTDTATGALIVSGGVGIAKELNVGGNVVFNKTTEFKNNIIVGNSINITPLELSYINGVTGNIQLQINSLGTSLVSVEGVQTINGEKTFSSVLNVTNTTESTDTATGALVVSGGVGIAEELHVGGNVVFNKTTEFKGDIIVANSTIITPFELSCIDGVTSNIQNQINSLGTSLVSIASPQTIYGAKTFSSALSVSDPTASTNTATGALRIIGGIGVGGSIHTGGNVIINSTIASSDTSSGALVVSGGVGIAKELNVGGNVVFNKTTEFKGNIIVANSTIITPFELSCIDGVTSNIQNQINSLGTAGSLVSIESIQTISGAKTFSNVLKVTNATASSNISSGALVVSGGVGITEALHVGGRITALDFNAVSDMRIKKNITDLNLQSLELIRKIRPREYTMIDGSTESVYGFIAQEVQELIPKSVHLSSGYIPSIYENAFVNGNTITLINKTTIDISCGKLKLRDKHSQDIIVNVTSIQDNKKFQIDKNILENVSYMDISGNYLDKQINNGITNYMIGSQIHKGEVKYGIFVYGSEVNDFQTINKDTIWTITLSATQEMDRQLQDAKYTIRTLEERILAIEILVKCND
jgi:hypothetical protein